MNTLTQPRKGQGSDTGNPGHFAKMVHPASPTVLPRTQEQLVALIEENLPEDIEVCTAGDVEDCWPVDSGDFHPAAATDLSDFAENLQNAPGWETDLEAFTQAIPEDYLYCTRSFDAWSYGTMSPEDFVYLRDDPEYIKEIHEKFVNHPKTKENNR